MKRYPYPPHLPPSTLILLGQHQHPAMELDTVMRLVYAHTLPIDTIDQAIAACRRALIEADDRRAGRMRLWIEDLVQPDASTCMGIRVVESCHACMGYPCHGWCNACMG